MERSTFTHSERSGRRIAKLSDQATREGIERVLGLGNIANTLRRDLVAHVATREVSLSTQTVTTTGLFGNLTPIIGAFSNFGKATPVVVPVVPVGQWKADAEKVIMAKATSLGWVGNTTGDTVAVPGGFCREFENADILVGDSGIAYEVNGDIRKKYNMLGGPGGPLGLPLTDETTTPDGIGRYNHFQNHGSIYWTPTTGPMMVLGRVREEWGHQGREQGPMGYPVQDQQHMPALYPTDHPNLGWCLFQNGALLSIAGDGATALVVDITPDELCAKVRSLFDHALKEKDTHLGLEAEVDLDAVSDWSYGFWAASPRLITFGLHGFRDNSDLSTKIEGDVGSALLNILFPGSAAAQNSLPDTTFDLQVRLRFATTWPRQFTYPSSVTLTAALDWASCNATGPFSNTLTSQMIDGIVAKFHRGGPDPEHPEVPDGAILLKSLPTGANQTGDGNLDVIDIMTTAQGGLQVLLNPLPPLAGNLRRWVAQQGVDQFLAG